MRRPTLLALALAGCGARGPHVHPAFDPLTQDPPRAERRLMGVPIDEALYDVLRTKGETWFREGLFGTERSVTDVMGLLSGTVEVPCDAGRCAEPVLPRVAAAIDALDGVPGNLFEGNGGFDGGGFTTDLVLEFPPGSTLHGLPIPARLHTGLDVEAGSAWPIGVVPVAAPPEDQGKPWLIEPSALTDPPLPGAPEGSFRLRLSCAACHYSLDVDQDGRADLRSARVDQPTPGSPWSPSDAWTPGNNDLHFGWLFALSANPLLGAVVISGDPDDRAAPGEAFGLWLSTQVATRREDVLRAVVRGMLLQPRGWADVSPNAHFDTIQIPHLLTRGHWPANTNGAFAAPEDRNNAVWTGALDFTGLTGLAHQGKGAKKDGFFAAFDAESYVSFITVESPVARYGTEADLDALRRDILGTADGVPGLLGPDGVVVVHTPLVGTMPDEVYAHPDNEGRRRVPEDLGPEAVDRRFTLAPLGVRLGMPAEVAADPELAPARSLGLPPDELVSGVVSLFLDSLDPAPNESALLASASDRVAEGAVVFAEAGCLECHSGPYLTDNLIHPADDRGYGRGPTPVYTDPRRADSARAVRVVSAPYDPATGDTTGPGGPIRGVLRRPAIGYKSTTLRGLWQTAPYLHDGGVAVAVAPGTVPPDDLAARLALAGTPSAWYGAGPVVVWDEGNPDPGLRPDAALSLQALVLESERRRVTDSNREAVVPVLPPGPLRPTQAPPVATVSMADLGVTGVGHPFWLDDAPGGPRVTALVAFLLAIDDCPRVLPAGSDPRPCSAEW